MSSDYFDSSDHQQVAATRARASAINNALDAIDTGLALLPTEANIKRGLINYGVDSGAADAYVVTLPYTAAALTDGMQVVFKASAANTGACTINVDSLGVKSIKRHDGTDPVAGDIGTNKITELRYNSTTTTFEIQGNVGMAAGAGTLSAQNANAVAITGGTITGVIPEASNGFMRRSQFTFVDVDTITVGAGAYDVYGTIAKITSTLTTTAHGLTASAAAYLYIDYSSIPAGGILLQADLIWSLTPPVWSDTYLAYYNGSDRCIFGVELVANEIQAFNHARNYVACPVGFTEGNPSDTYAALTNAFPVPTFCTSVNVLFRGIFVDTTTSLLYRTDTASTDTPVLTLRAGADHQDNTMQIVISSTQQIQWKEATAGNNTYGVDLRGWYLPEGI